MTTATQKALADAKRDLTRQVKALQGQLSALDTFERSFGMAVASRTPNKAQKRSQGGKRRMSASGRARIGAAARKRWAAYRKERAKKTRKHTKKV